MAFKAFDGIADDLSRHLQRQPADVVTALLPAESGLLARVFSALERVMPGAHAERHDDESSPQDFRVRLFAAVRSLLARIAARQPLVLVVDDLHWADGDSLALLDELMNGPEAPALLLVVTARTGWTPPDWLAVAQERVVGLPLVRLEPADARELADLLVRLDGGAAATADSGALADEADGHPFFLAELVRHARAGRRSVPLAEALRDRITRLDPATRALLEVVGAAGAPVSRETAARATELRGYELDRHVTALRVARLIRTSPARKDELETFHDRVRQAVLGHLSAPNRRAVHRRLADAIEQSSEPDPERLLTHWREAGEPARAGGYAERAAERANEKLAFDQAARLYGEALTLGAPVGVARAALLQRHAVALANAGRSRAAADAYLEAAALVPRRQRLELDCSAAEQLLIGGHVDGGLVVLRSVLRQVGVRVPGSPLAMVTKLMRLRAQLWIEQRRGHARTPLPTTPELSTRIDVCYSAAVGLCVIDPLQSVFFHTLSYLGALQIGDARRIARSLPAEITFYAGAGRGRPGSPRTARLIQRAEARSAQLDDPRAIALTEGHAGAAALLDGRWRIALERCERAIELFRTRCAGAVWEIDCLHLAYFNALFYLGRLPELVRLVPTLTREAIERGDRLALTNLRWGLPPTSVSCSTTTREASATCRRRRGAGRSAASMSSTSDAAR